MDKKYLTYVQAADEYNKQQHDKWNTAIKMYKGEITAFRKKALKGWQHLVEVNFTRPTIDTMLPSILFQSPKVIMSPAQEMAMAEIQAQALQIENKMNAILMELDHGTEYKRATKDALLFGHGFVKYGLTTDVGYDKDDYPFPAPFCKRVSPWDVLIDPAARDSSLKDASYVAFRNIIPTVRARKDPLLRKADRLESTCISNYLPEHVKEERGSKMRAYEFTTLYELWLLEENKLIVLDGSGNIYRKDDWPYDLRGEFPLVTFSFIPVPEEFYGRGEPEDLYCLQLEASEKRTQQLNHTRRFNRKYRCAPDVSKDDKDALILGDDGTVVVSNSPIEPIADAPLQGDIIPEYQMISGEVKEVTGVSAYQRGGSESAVYSATAARIIDANANIRVEERRQELAKAMARGARILYRVLSETEKWPVLDFNFRVDISTMQRPDDEGRRAQLLQLGQILREFPQFKPDNFLRDVAIAFHKPPEQYLFTPEEMQQRQGPSPEEIKMQMEQQKLQAEMQMKQAEMQLNAQVEQSRAQLEQQKMQMEAQKMQLEVQKTEMELKKIEMEIQKAQVELELEKQKMVIELEFEKEKLAMEKEKMAMDQENSRFEQRMSMNSALIQERQANSDSEFKNKQLEGKQAETKAKAKAKQAKKGVK